MSTTNIDIYNSDRKFHHINMSSEEDIYELLWILDIIYLDAEKGNKEAMAIFNDFISLIDELKENSLKEILYAYIKIQLGCEPYKEIDLDKDIIELIAYRQNIPLKECEERLHNAILQIKDINNTRWKEWINKKVDNYCFYSDIKKSKASFTDNNIQISELDRKYKYENHKKNIINKEVPQELSQLIELQNSNEEKLKNLREVKNKTLKQKKELNTRIKYNKQLYEDISELKKHYSINCSSESSDSKYNMNKYINMDLEEVINNTVKEEDMMQQQLDGWLIDRIKRMAYKVLTSKQYTIFYLYFFNDIKQQQIADILGEHKENISRDLKVSINKIKNNL